MWLCFPTAAVTNRFEFWPQMKALGSVSAVKHLVTTMPTQRFNTSAFPWAGPKSVMSFCCWILILFIREYSSHSVKQYTVLEDGAIRRAPVNRLWTCSCVVFPICPLPDMQNQMADQITSHRHVWKYTGLHKHAQSEPHSHPILCPDN